MNTVFQKKELAVTDSPFLVFDCVLADGTAEHWSTQSVTIGSTLYTGRVAKHNLLESQTASDQGVDSVPRLVLELANADSHFSELERSTGFKGALITATFVFVDLPSGLPTTDSKVVFQGVMNAAELVTETAFRLSAMNRLSSQRVFLPPVQIQRRCAWTFPSTSEQRTEALDGGVNGRFSRYYPCGYSADQPGGCGNLNNGVPFTSCTYTRSDCEARGMFNRDSQNQLTSRFSGIEFVPSTITVRAAGESGSQLSAVSINEARYNDFVPLIYGTAWVAPEIVFARNDGNLTRMEVLLGMGPMTGVHTVLVNNIEIPLGVSGMNMTGTGWYNVISLGARNGGFDLNFTDSSGNPLGDPYGSMAYLAVVVPNRINNGSTLPDVQVLVDGVQVRIFNPDGSVVGDSFSSNPCWIILDALLRTGWTANEVDLETFAAAAVYCDEQIQTVDANNNPISIPRFQCNLPLTSRRSLGDVLRGIRNTARLYFTFGFSGLLQVNVENTIALQQPALPDGSNATAQLNGGWPAYEFGDGSSGVSGILRNADGSSTVRLTSKSSSDCPNQYSVEFQDAFNQYQQDSFSVVDADDAAKTGQQVASTLYALGLPNYDQAARILTFNLQKSVYGNLIVEFQTSVKGLGLFPGDIISFTYEKEGFQRQPFRILKLAPAANYRRVTITAQLHDDAWYTDDGGANGSGQRLPGAGIGLARPLTGTVLDGNGNLQFDVQENATQAPDGTVSLGVSVGFVSPGKVPSSAPGAPIVSLTVNATESGGSLAGAQVLYYAVSAIDSSGNEGPLSFIVRATIPAGPATYAVTLSGLSFPSSAATFQVYRGLNPTQLNLIAGAQPLAGQFIDTGFAPQPVLPPDPNYDHANFYWRLELQPEANVTSQNATMIGSNALEMTANEYRGATVRITRGTGAAQERSVIANDVTTITTDSPWDVIPDSTSFFTVSQAGYQFGATSTSNIVQFSIPNRPGATLEISGRSANIYDIECPYELSPLTRWEIGSSGIGTGDTSVPPTPFFGLDLSPSQGGTIQLGAVGFGDLTNTTTVSAGTYTFHYYDELLGPPQISIGKSIDANDTTITLNAASTGTANSLAQLDQELLEITQVSSDGLTIQVSRGINGTLPAAHSAGTLFYTLSTRVLTVPFIDGFFGSPSSGDWNYPLPFPNIRLATAELFVTNSQGNSPSAFDVFTAGPDQGLRTLSGGQYSFQVAGFLAVQTGAAPDISVEGFHVVRDVFAVIRSAPTDSSVGVNVNLDGTLLCSLSIPAGSTTSNLVRGLLLPVLTTGSLLSMDITSVGQTVPGSDLTVVIRV
jgi:Putative phage tail protein